MGTLNLIGTIISIIAAGYSIYQAIKAKNSATAAQEAKESIEKYKSTLNLQKLLAHAKEIEALLVKITAPNPTTGKGRNIKKDHEAIERFVSVLNDNQGIHRDSTFCDFILNEYEWFVAQTSLDPKPYNDILYHIRAIIREINGIIHDRTFE